MKKNLIYTVAVLLCGSLLFGSCQDMLNVDSDRVEYEFDGWIPSDSVYSVLGILKAVQGVADRHILLNELRADLVTISESKAIAEVQEIYSSNFANMDENKYLDVTPYYTIINNCNLFLSRVDTTLYKDGKFYMMPEYVAVKSIRAWTYLQLVINHRDIPYFTEPITKHSVAEEVMSRPKVSREVVLDNLIADIAPYENPFVYPMPVWYNMSGSAFGSDFNALSFQTYQLFVPIRMLLGELYLWKKDYQNAIRYFYAQITRQGAGQDTSVKYGDYSNYVRRSSLNQQGTTNVVNNYSSLFEVKSNIGKPNEKGSILTVVPFAENDEGGTTSELASIFSPQNDAVSAQVYASPGIISLAAIQKYCNDADTVKGLEYGDKYNYKGDLRIKATTYSQYATDQMQTKYSNIIAKFNLESDKLTNLPKELDIRYQSGIPTRFITLQRVELAYLRLAEALVGLDKQIRSNGYVGAMEIAMDILKNGVKDSVYAVAKPIVTLVDKKDENGDVILDENGNAEKETLVEYQELFSLNFNLPDFKGNKGIHSRGSGNSELNTFYALDSACIARYLGCTEYNEEGAEVPSRPIEYQDSLTYMNDIIIDELALELSWEGFRFGDLVRFAEAMEDKEVLAKRIAGRNEVNEVTYRHPEYKFDNVLLEKMSNEANWYIPLPDTVVK